MRSLNIGKQYEDVRLSEDEGSPVLRIEVSDRFMRDFAALWDRYKGHLDVLNIGSDMVVGGIAIDQSLNLAAVIKDVFVTITDEPTYNAVIGWIGGGAKPEECNTRMLEVVGALSEVVAEKIEEVKRGKANAYLRSEPDAI